MPRIIDTLFSDLKDQLHERALDIVTELDTQDAPGHQKMREAIDRLSEYADDALTWEKAGLARPMLEAVDGVAIKWVLRGFLECALVTARQQLATDY